VIASHVDHQYQVEIPRRPIYRQFNVAVGRCACCEGRVQGRHRLQTSNALGCCASQIASEAQAAVVMLNKELGLSQGKISRFFQMFFGIQLTRGGSCQIMLRAAERCEGNHQAIVKRVQSSPWIVPDETGWRIGGWLAWLHVAVSQDAVAYLIARPRGVEASALLIGEDYAGKLIHDGWASYDRFWRALHQTCLGHLLRRCHELLEHATRGAVVFPRRVKALLQESLEVRDRRDQRQISLRQAVAQADALQERMTQLVSPVKTHAANERFCRHLLRHTSQLFTFLRHRGIDATNYQAEQALRPAVVNRKVWGGNRTPAGAVAQSILMTVLFTATRQRRNAMEFVSEVLRSLPGRRPMLLGGSG
jgi:transposase